MVLSARLHAAQVPFPGEFSLVTAAGQEQGFSEPVTQSRSATG